MKYEMIINGVNFTLEHNDFENHFNIDDLTLVDGSNLYGEAATISSVMVRVGLQKDELSKMDASLKYKVRQLENDITTSKRVEAHKNSNKYSMTVGGEVIYVKATEKALDTCFMSDPEWKKGMSELIELEGDLAKFETLYWGVKSKDKKLNNFMSGVNPDYFSERCIEGTYNGITILNKK